GRVGVADSRIAGSPVRYPVGDIPAGSFFKSLNYIQYAVTLTGAQVVSYYARTFRQFIERFEVANSQIHYVDIIAYAGAVVSRVIVTKDRQFLQLSDGYLGDIRHQVIRDIVGILTNAPAFMGTDRVEIAEQRYIPRFIGRV